MKARVMPSPPSLTGRQHVQVQSGSMGEKSAAKEAWRRLRLPDEVMALPKRWMEVGINNEIQACNSVSLGYWRNRKKKVVRLPQFV